MSYIPVEMADPAPRRIVVFTGALNYTVRRGIVEIDESIPALQWLVVVHAPRKTFRYLLRSQWRNLRRNGWRWIPYQSRDLWERLRESVFAPASATGPGREFSTDSFRVRTNVRIVVVDDIHSQASIELVRDFEPALGLSLAAPILLPSLFTIPTRGTMNLHKGKLPEFRGMPPAFWELWHGQTSVGCSVHMVDRGLDTGDLIAEATLPRAPHATLRGLQLQLDEIGVRLTASAVATALADQLVAQRQPAGVAKTHRKPTLRQQLLLHRQLAPRLPLAQRPRQFLKEARASTAFALHAAGITRALAPRITVLLYHRVSDDVRDNLTVGIEQFERQMALLVRHFQVMAIEDVLAAETISRSDRPRVAVTFDDGYMDNYEHAAPILRRHGIPAAFFISTGIVGSQGRFPHDIQRRNPPIALMTWESLRTLRRWGFTIGSHTVNHIDCAAEPEQTVQAELATSRDDLRREVDVRSSIFAYPYGGKQHMTPQRLQLVRDAGYVGCLSAYGGTNVGAVDRFNVRRRSISCAYSDRLFLLECLGLRDV